MKRSRVDSVQRTPNTALKDLNLNTVDRNPKAAAALLCKLDSCGDAQTQGESLFSHFIILNAKESRFVSKVHDD